MDVIKQYSAALELYKAKQFEEALTLARDVQSAAPHWKKSFLLEAYIRREQHEYLKELQVLEELLPRFNLNSPDEKSLATTAASLAGAVYRELGLTAEAIENFLLSATLESGGEKSCVEISNAIFTANSAENFSAKDFRVLYDEYKKYSADITPFAKKFYSHKKIRVGFLSANFARHVVMNWGLDILNELDRNLFEVCCYSAVSAPDDVIEYFRTKAELWRDIIGLTDAQIAELIRGDEIDILFDLNGHTADNRLRVAAYRPASVQVSGVGYMNSTGLDCFDYHSRRKTPSFSYGDIRRTLTFKTNKCKIKI